MLDESQNSGYAKYNGKHTINGVEVTTQSVMVNDYGGSNVIQCKAKEGKITLSEEFPRSYTLEVTLDASKTCVYEIGCQSSVSGMRCFASIIFYA